MAQKTKKTPATPAVENPEAELQARAEAARKARIEAASTAIAAALTQHRCVLDVSVLVTATGNVPQVQIVALE